MQGLHHASSLGVEHIHLRKVEQERISIEEHSVLRRRNCPSNVSSCLQHSETATFLPRSSDIRAR